MPRKKRSYNIQQVHLNIQPSFVVFNIQNDEPQHCGICLKSHALLINPCFCHSKYHEKCILRYIKGVLEQHQRVNDEIELNVVRCRYCDNSFKIHCKVFIKKMNRSCCNRHIIVIIFLFVSLILSVTFLNQYFIEPTSKRRDIFFFVVIAAIIILSLVLILVFSHFIQTYSLYKLLILQKVYELTQARSSGSDNSDQNKISDDYDIIIRVV